MEADTRSAAYDRIIQNMRQYSNDVPMRDGWVSEAFGEYIKLMFTPAEAEVAQHLALRPPPAGRLSQRILNFLSKRRFVQNALLRQSIEENRPDSGVPETH